MFCQKNNNIIALIPARGGSKRVKNKNIRHLMGKPLIAYSIEAALNSRGIDRVIVSTDSEEIAEIAIKYGAEVPFLRPSELSTSDSTEFEFHEHAITWLNNNESYVVDVIVNLYPTTPFRKAESITEALERFLSNKESDSLRSVRKCKEHPYKMWVKNQNYLNRFISSGEASFQTLSYHLLPEIFIQNASIYIVKAEVIKQYKNTIGEKVLYYEMGNYESLDINYVEDFYFAEYLFHNGLSF